MRAATMHTFHYFQAPSSRPYSRNRRRRECILRPRPPNPPFAAQAQAAGRSHADDEQIAMQQHAKWRIEQKLEPLPEGLSIEEARSRCDAIR